MIDNIKLFARPFFYFGFKVNCPVCGWNFRRFLPSGAIKRKYSKCPKCSSKERHRLLWLYLNAGTELFKKRCRLLHIAPEKGISEKIRKQKKIEYVSMDLNSPLATVKMDITSLAFKENTFDYIICSHVLEHIEDDNKAIKEMFRVLKPGGQAFIMCPVDFERAETYEDPAINTPEGRLTAFHQADHVRIYGRDFIKRLQNAGFAVSVEEYAAKLSEDLVKKYGLLKNGKIYVCGK